jgi:capsular exopolysaccharide synthesis family protein
VALRDPEGAASEAFRTVRTNLFYSLVDEPPKVITVTSPHPREGKSFVCANLGVVLAQAEKNTLVVDCDLRRPVLHDFFGERNLRGIVNILAGEVGLEEVWLEPLLGLKVVCVGPVPLHPAELLSSRRFAEFLRQAREGFDYVLLDAPPTQVVADAAIIAAQGDGVLLVFDAQHTLKRTVRRSVRSLETVGANVLGTVMNNMNGSRKATYQDYAL